jgi:hypothetical protein
MKLHHFPAGARTSASYTETKIHPLWRCVCGRVLKAYDVDVREGGIVIDCGRCFTRLFEHRRTTESA